MSPRITGLACLVLATAALACRRAPDPAKPSPLRFETRTFEKEMPGCGDQAKRPQPCVTFRIQWPETKEAPNEAALMRMNAAILAALQPKEAPRGFEAEASQLIADFERFHAEFPDSGITYFVRRRAEVIFANRALTSIEIRWDEFRGGAHPESHREYLNLAPSSGQAVLLDDMLAPGAMSALTAAAERRFRAGRGIPGDRKLSDAGFAFEEGRFALPREWGVDAQGLIFHFNPGDIAAQDAGATTFTIPWNELRGIVRPEAGILPQP